MTERGDDREKKSKETMKKLHEERPKREMRRRGTNGVTAFKTASAVGETSKRR